MNREFDSHYAGLIFAQPGEIDLVTLCRRICDWLEDNDHRVDSQRHDSDNGAVIVTREFSIAVALDATDTPAGGDKTGMDAPQDRDGSESQGDPAQASGAHVALNVIPHDDTQGLRACERTLLYLTYRLVNQLCPASVEWQTRSVALERSEFIAVFIGHIRPARPAPVAPQSPSPRARVRDTAPRSGRAADIRDEAVMAALRETFRTDPEAEDQAGTSLPQRLAAWALSLAVAMFCLPVAAALVVLNIGRGPDLRTAAHAMALTGFFLTLDGANALDVMAIF